MRLYLPLLMTRPPTLTDRTALALHRTRAARHPAFFLHEDAAGEIEERLAEINKSYTAPLFIGHATPPLRALFPDAPLIEDAEHLSAQPQAHDLILHAFGLHWADDPVGQLVQSRLALQPDGLFLGVMFGGATLQELRAALAQAETTLTGGLSPRVLPMADIRDLGGLLQRAGLALPVADSRKLTVRYPDLATLIRDLRGMGETNALAARHRISGGTLAAQCARLRHLRTGLPDRLGARRHPTATAPPRLGANPACRRPWRPGNTAQTRLSAVDLLR